MMKMGVTGFPPLTFRAICLLMGVPVLWLALRVMKVPFYVPRKDWLELFWLAVTNMFIWHVLIILAISVLSSGRAAIPGYTMPEFSALLGVAFSVRRCGARSGWVLARRLSACRCCSSMN